MRRLALTSALVLVLSSGCSNASKGDKLTPPDPSPIGTGLRLREVNNPDLASRPGPGAVVDCTGLSVVHVDAFDETRDGKSVGTMYVQDVGSQEPYSGIGTFGAAFIPANLRVAPGDVLDMSGQYQENKNIGAAVFPPGQVLPQLFRPTATFRYEAAQLVPTEIDVNDLADFSKGRRWMGMLVTIRDITVQGPVAQDGRVTARLLAANTSNVPTLTNELYDLKTTDIPAGTQFKSITGVVTYFFNLHLAPRSPADLVR